MIFASLNTYCCVTCGNIDPANLEIYSKSTICTNCRRESLGKPKIPSNIFYPEIVAKKERDTIPAPAPDFNRESYGDGDSSATVNDDDYDYAQTYLGAFGDYDGA